MRDQPRREPLEGSAFFEDGRASRPRVPGTVARGRLKTDTHLHEGKVRGSFAETFPFAMGREDLRRGRERYGIYCAPCHDALGTGRGVVVRRGFRPPASFHDEKVRSAPVGRYIDAMTKGLGAMPSYADVTSAEDRWRIVAYVRALQLSQNSNLEDLPEDDQRRLDALNP